VLQVFLCIGVSLTAWAMNAISTLKGLDDGTEKVLGSDFNSYYSNDYSYYDYDKSYSYDLGYGWNSSDVSSWTILGTISLIMAAILWLATFISMVYFCN